MLKKCQEKVISPVKLLIPCYSFGLFSSGSALGVGGAMR